MTTVNAQRIVIDKSNPYSLWQVSDSCLDSIVNSSTHWHRFTIINGTRFEREKILRSIIEEAYPADLVPVKYQTEGKDTFFLARNCGPAIKKLCSSSLTIKFPNSHKQAILRLVLCYKLLTEEPIVMKTRIATANINRFNYQLRILDLTLYHRDPELKDIFTLLCIPKTMRYVLNLSKQYYSRMTMLVLASNNLTNLEDLQSLVMSKTLKSLDLRDNKLTWEALGQLPSTLRLKDIWLDGNPLCNTYSSSLDYISHVRSILPSIETIDDKNVGNSIDMCEYLTRNFLVQPSISCPFVDQFLSLYMKLFEGEQRWQLGRMYHSKAVFSLSASHLQGQTTSVGSNLTSYMPYSRNILTISNYAKIYDQLKRGPDDIMDALCKLPKIQFDPYSFTVDVPIFEDKIVFINLTGVFRDLNNILLVYSFHRTFVLQPCRTNIGEWKIINDMLTVTNATTHQANKSFTKGDLSLSKMLMDKLLMDEDEKNKLIDTLSSLTTMNNRWAKKFLEDASWDLEVALQAFTDQYKTGSMGVDAFREDSVNEIDG